MAMDELYEDALKNESGHVFHLLKHPGHSNRICKTDSIFDKVEGVLAKVIAFPIRLNRTISKDAFDSLSTLQKNIHAYHVLLVCRTSV